MNERRPHRRVALLERPRTGWARAVVSTCGAVAALALLAASCASPESDPIVLGDDVDSGGRAPSFTPPPPEAGGDGGDGAVTNPAPLMCVVTADMGCPPPLATCGTSRKCGTDLSKSVDNCGACGVDCFQGVSEVRWNHILHADPRCVSGQCTFLCDTNIYPYSRDCNGRPDDGCETDVYIDGANCGACGNVCATGVPCISGQCGCPPDKTLCGTKCVDIRDDEANCGACGHACSPPQGGCSPLPWNTSYACGGGTCGVLACKKGTADCDNDFVNGCASNGCETDTTTVANCGGCGLACAPGQKCADLNDGKGARCVGCGPGQTMCGSAAFPVCRDLLDDPLNCGACGNVCPKINLAGSVDNGDAVCRKGVCGYECIAGKADCDGDPTTGCETDLASDALHCGACGTRCDTAGGQPCVDGACLMAECDAGSVVTK